MENLTDYEMTLLQRMGHSLTDDNIDLTEKEESDISRLLRDKPEFRKAYETDPIIGPILRAMNEHSRKHGVPVSDFKHLND